MVKLRRYESIEDMNVEGEIWSDRESWCLCSPMKGYLAAVYTLIRGDKDKDGHHNFRRFELVIHDGCVK